MARTRNKQSVVAFSLSFLDVLCCGLGAAVLLLLIVKHGPVEPEIIETEEAPIDVTEIQAQIAQKTERKTELQKIAADTAKSLESSTKSLGATEPISNLQQTQLSSLIKQVQEQRHRLQQAQTKLNAANAIASRARETKPQEPSATHLTGLQIMDDRVAILLDSSASMLAETLPEIVRYRASPKPVQQQSPKWQSARDAALWVLNKLPSGANYQVLNYSNSIRDARGTLLPPPRGGILPARAKPGWERKNDPKFPTNQLTQVLDELRAFGPTDLKSVLNAAASIEPKPQQIVLITDGLPTMPGMTSLSRLQDCPSPPRGTTPILSPQCRQSVMNNAINMTRKNLFRVRLDVILLPLEGDSNAVEAYWHLAHQRGGRLLTPVSGWPTI